ncbi:UNVERIFIED_CONTAM: hypothetical protein GTU68_042686 [Idotea baltica]|nr:hypothetical protein [Idotea baltica]
MRAPLTLTSKDTLNTSTLESGRSRALSAWQGSLRNSTSTDTCAVTRERGLLSVMYA